MLPRAKMKKWHFGVWLCFSQNQLTTVKKKGKAIPVTGDPQGCETLRVPHYLDNRLTDGGKVVILTRRPPFTPPGRFLVLICVRGWVDPRAIVRLEGLRQLKKIHLIGTRTRDLPACSIVPQATTLQQIN
jgi:hypothetical protein